MRCPRCTRDDDKVVDSRAVDAGAAIRRRRECVDCGHRFTTFERSEEQCLMVLKRSGDSVPFDPGKLVSGVAAAAKGRPVAPERLDALSFDVEEACRLQGEEVTSEQVGLAVLDRLRTLDEVTYMRFASVYKNFDAASDFEAELQVLHKDTAPKHHGPTGDHTARM